MWHLQTIVIFCVFACATCVDYYKVLGVDRDASLIQIKRAYKKLAKELHPDKAENPEAVREKYQEVQAAYEILRDNEKRRQYDETGEDGSSDEAKQWQYHRARNLFNDDNDVLSFETEDEWEAALYGEEPVIVFFWQTDPPDPAIKGGEEYKKFAKRWRGLLRCYQLSCDYFRRMCNNNGGFHSPSLAMVGKATIRWHRGRMLDYAMSDLAYRVVSKWVVPKARIREFGPEDFPMISCFHLVAFEVRSCDECIGEVAAAWGRITAFFMKKAYNKATFPKLKLARINCDDYPEYCEKYGIDTSGYGGANIKLAAMCPDDPDMVPAPSSDTMIPAHLKLTWQRQMGQQIAWLNAPDQEGVIMHNDIMVFLWQQLMPLVTLVNNEDHFNNMVLQDTDAYLVSFMPPHSQCPECQDVMVDLDTIARLLKGQYSQKYDGVVKMVRVECSWAVSLCSSFEQMDWQHPLIVVYPYTVEAKKQPQVYDGQFNIENILNMVQKEAEPVTMVRITKKNSGQLQTGNWLTLWTAGSWCPPCMQMKDIYKDAARILDGNKKLKVAIVDCDNHKAVCNANGIDGYPTIQAMIREGARPAITDFDGSREPEEIANWAIDSIDNVVFNYGRDLITKTNSGTLMLVAFSAGQWCPPCMKAKGTMAAVGRRLLGKYEVGIVNCDQWQRLCMNFGIQAYPTFILYTMKKGKRKTLVFDGTANVDPLVSWAEKHLPKEKKKELGL